jgi:hypothetical protein
MHRLMRLAAIGLLLAAPGWVLAQQVPPRMQCAAAPVPPGSKLELITSRIEMDGLPMAIVQASSTLPTAAFLQFDARTWVTPQGKPRYVRYPLGPWQVIAHAGGGCFYTVQVKAQGAGTAALIGVSMPNRVSGHATMIDVTAPADSHAIMHMVSEDSGKLGNTWLLYTANSPDTVVQFYMHALQAQGWLRVMQQAVPMRPGVTTAMYQKGAANIGLVVQPMRAGSSITITQMTH